MATKESRDGEQVYSKRLEYDIAAASHDYLDEELKIGAEGPAVEYLQGYLAEFGFIESEVTERMQVPRERYVTGTHIGIFDEKTSEAVRLFQKFYDLKVTGTVTEETALVMETPRCGIADTDEYVIDGRKWKKNPVEWHYLASSETTDLERAIVRDRLKRQFDRWSNVSSLKFVEVAYRSNPAIDIVIRFATGRHGCESAFDGRNGTLAHAYYPPPNGGRRAGNIHFDDAERWRTGETRRGIHLATVALHEIGHSLGLGHTGKKNAVMYAYYTGRKLTLDVDDIAGVRRLYGA